MSNQPQTLSSTVIYFLYGITNNVLYGWASSEEEARGPLTDWVRERFGVEVVIVEGKEFEIMGEVA